MRFESEFVILMIVWFVPCFGIAVPVNIHLNSREDQLQNSKRDWCQNAVGFAAPCPAGAGSSTY